MKGTIRKQFPFEAIDRKAAEGWLNRLGEQGWRLGAFQGGRADFWQTGRPVRYAVAARRGRDSHILCRDAGWDFLASNGTVDVYAALAGRRPAPLETDGTLESREFLRKCLLRTLTLGLLFLLWAGLSLWKGARQGPLAGSWPGGALWGLWLALFVLSAAMLAWDARYLLRVRRTGEVAARPMAGIWLRRGLFQALKAVTLLWMAAELFWP